MKRMNFINAISAQKHQKVTRWFAVSCAATCISVVGMVILQSIACYDLYATHRELTAAQTRIDAFTLQCQAKEPLQQKKANLAKLKSHIAECTLCPCSPHDTLCMLTKLAALPLNLQSVSLHPEGMEVTAHASGVQHATRAMEEIKKSSGYSNIELVSISPGTKGLMFRVKGKK